MVLSSKNSASRFVGRYAQYKDQLKYYPIGREGQEKYVLIYGSFPSSTEALEQKAGMPNEFNQALVKSFKQIQKESRRKN
jgi:DamX protein